MRKLNQLAILCLGLLLAFAPAVHAQEEAAKKPSKADMKKAQLLVQKAYQACNTDAKSAEKLTQDALKLYPDYLQARLFLGWLYNIKLGQLEDSIKQYDYVIRHTPKETVAHRKFKAQAFCEKGNVIFASRRDATAALENYNMALRVFPTWQYAEVASNLYLHIGDVEKAHDRVTLAHELLTRLEQRVEKDVKNATGRKKAMAEARKKQIPEQKLKVKIQLATCLTMKKKGEEAKALLNDVKEFPINVKYNLAVLRCVQKDLDASMKCLQEFMKTRETPEARDQLREFIVNEHGLAGLKSHKDYAALTKMETEKYKKKAK